MAQLEIHTLGGVKLLLDDAVFDRLSTRKVEALVIYLAYTRRTQPREILADMLWDDRSQTRAQTNLRVAITNLRKHLGSFFIITRNDITLDPEAGVWFDAAELDSSLSAAQTEEKEHGQLTKSAVEQITSAVSLYQGEFLQGFHVRQARGFDEWLTVERERLHRSVLDGLSKLVEWQIEQGEYTSGIEQARRWLSLDPLSELAHQQMMRLLAYSGQPGAAIRQYQECVDLLDEELGLPPSPATTAIYEAIQARKLAPPPQAETAPTLSYGEEPAVPVELPAFLSPDAQPPSIEETPFVGREQELATLNRHLKQALTDKGRVVFVTGEAGQGKTTLLSKFARQAQAAHPDLVVATGASPVYTPVSAPYAIFREVLEMLTGDVESAWLAGTIRREQAIRLWHLLPEMVAILLQQGRNLVGSLVMAERLIQRATSASIESHQLDRLNELLAQVTKDGSPLSDQGELFAEYTVVLKALSTRRPLLLVLDDLHWADPASIGLLGHLGNRLAEMGILMVGAYRPEEVNRGREGERHPLLAVLGEYQRRFGDVQLPLDDVASDGVRLFVDALLDSEPNVLGEEFRHGLVHHTGGNPLFTVELLREMQGRGVLKQDGMGRWFVGPDFTWDVMPPRVEGVIETRIKRLDSELQEWLTVASVEGEIFTAELIARVQDTDERAIVKRLSSELDKQHHLVKVRSVRRSGSQRLSHYLFRHNLFRQYLYDRLDEIERSYLHEQVGEALEQLFEGQSGEIADQLAHHFQMADNDAKALQYLILAADDAVRLYAYDQAVIYYTKAIEAAERLALEAAELVNLHLKRASAYETLGAFERSRADNEKALRIAQAAGQRELEWQALLGLGKAWASHDYNKTGEYFKKALDLARQIDDPVMVARSLNRMGNWYSNTNKLQDAIDVHEQAFEIFQELQDKQGMADTLDLTSWVYYYRGDYVNTAEYFDRAIALFRELDDRVGLSSALANRGSMNAYYEYHPVPSVISVKESIPFLEESYQITKDIGWRSQESYALWSLATRYFAFGEFGRGVEMMHEGLNIASEIDHKYWTTGELFDLGLMYCGLYAPEKAQECLQQASPLAGEIESEHFSNLINGTLAKTYFLQDDLMKMQTCLENVIDPDSSMETTSERYCGAQWANLLLAQGEPAKTIDIIDRLIASIPGLLPDRVISSLWRLRGEALLAMGQIDQAESMLLTALRNAKTFDEYFHLWRIHASLGGLYQEMNRQEEAQNENSIARELVDNLATTIPDQNLKDNFLQVALALLDHSASVL